MSVGIPSEAVIGRFKVIRKLGEGAFGRVFLAEDPMAIDEQKRLVAVKLPHPHVFQDMAMQLRFFRELKTIASLNRIAGVCHYLEQGMHHRSMFIVMDYIDGETLADALRKTKKRPLSWVLTLVHDIALIMADVHSQKVVHRDLKPSNVMLQAGDQVRPVVMDFGLARGDRSQELRLTRTGQVLGTPFYMAPEIIGGQAAYAGAAADIFSMGVMLFEMLTGRRPFEGPVHQLLEIVAKQPAQRPSQAMPGLPPELDQLCLEMLDKNPQQRFGGEMSKVALAVSEMLPRYRQCDWLVGVPDSSAACESTIIQPPEESPGNRT